MSLARPCSRVLPVLLLLGTALSSLAAAEIPAASLTLHADHPGAVIAPEIYGQFSEHLGRGVYEGIWVGPDSPIPNTRGIRNDVVAALKAIHIPVLRWPGGCFADEYHWQDGIGPRDQRPGVYNSNWGGVVENNAFGTHEFMDLCEQLGCAAYVCGNVGSGTVEEMRAWDEYLTSDARSPMANLRRAHGREHPWIVKFFGVGNESWGCGGNMTAEFYADNFLRYNTYLRNYDSAHKLYRIASGSHDSEYGWTETLMKKAGGQLDGISLHYYTIPTGQWKVKGSATTFPEAEWMSTVIGARRMETFVAGHAAILEKYDPKKRVGLIVDEWGTWYDTEKGDNPGFLYQQNTLRDAMVAGLHFHIFQAHADRVRMANIAQTINVLQAMILTDKEKMILTPTYHVFEMFKAHQGGTVLPVELTSPDYVLGTEKTPAVSASASRDAAGRITLSLVNVDPHHDLTVSCALAGTAAKSVSGRVLTAPTMQSYNSFTAPAVVAPQPFTGASLTSGGLTVTLPAKSVVVLTIE